MVETMGKKNNAQAISSRRLVFSQAAPIFNTVTNNIFLFPLEPLFSQIYIR